MKFILSIVTASALLVAPCVAATYALQITNNTNSAIFKVWVNPGEIDGTTCGDKDVCDRQVTVPDGVCKSDLTINMANGGRSKGSVYWCNGESVTEVELRR